MTKANDNYSDEDEIDPGYTLTFEEQYELMVKKQLGQLVTQYITYSAIPPDRDDPYISLQKRGTCI